MAVFTPLFVSWYSRKREQPCPVRKEVMLRIIPMHKLSHFNQKVNRFYNELMLSRKAKSENLLCSLWGLTPPICESYRPFFRYPHHSCLTGNHHSSNASVQPSALRYRPSRTSSTQRQFYIAIPIHHILYAHEYNIKMVGISPSYRKQKNTYTGNTGEYIQE